MIRRSGQKKCLGIFLTAATDYVSSLQRERHVQQTAHRNANSIPQLRADVQGGVITPEDAGYDAARQVFLGGIDKRPGAIVMVANADDVARVVSFARETGTELAVRSGGHSGSGHCTTDGGIVLDLRE